MAVYDAAFSVATVLQALHFLLSPSLDFSSFEFSYQKNT